MRNTRYALALGSLLMTGTALAQVTPPAQGQAPPPAPQQAPPPVPAAAKSAPYGPGMKINISPDGSKYIRMITWVQAYTRYNENNSNTYRAPNLLKSDQLDFGIRRARMILLAQLNPRFLILTHIGINNQNGVSGGVNATTDGKKPQIFFHEAMADYKVFKFLNVGGGIHYYNGISRLSSASVNSILPMDIPLTNFPTIDALDEFARYIGVFAHGRVGKFDYRISMSDPFLTNLPTASGIYSAATVANAAGTPLALGTTTTTTTAAGTIVTSTGNNTANYNPQNDSHVYQGYFSYSFLETEANLLPYYTGTYLGTKRVLNLGAGFMVNPNGMYSRPSSSSVVVSSTVSGTTGIPTNADLYTYVPTEKHDIKLFGADIFYDTPLDTTSARKTALTFYGVYYNFNFGPNYTRAVGPENPGYVNIGSSASLPANVNYRGNAMPQSGTGNAVYGQLGYLMSKRILGPKVRLQPYVAYLFSNYEGYHKPDGSTQNASMFDGGVNILLDGHNAKLTLNYRERPDFSNQTAIVNGLQINEVKYRPEVTLQMQVLL